MFVESEPLSTLTTLIPGEHVPQDEIEPLFKLLFASVVIPAVFVALPVLMLPPLPPSEFWPPVPFTLGDEVSAKGELDGGVDSIPSGSSESSTSDEGVE